MLPPVPLIRIEQARCWCLARQDEGQLGLNKRGVRLSKGDNMSNYKPILLTAFLVVFFFHGELSAADSALLAEGPLPITLQRLRPDGTEREEKGTLAFLYADRVHFRPASSGRVVTYQAKGGRVPSIAAMDGKYSWTYSPEKKEFCGTILSPQSVDVEPSPITPDQENLYLLLTMERLLRSVDDAILNQDKPHLDNCRDRVARLAAYCEKKGLQDTVTNHYRSMPEFIAKQEQLAREQRDVFVKATKRDEAFSGEIMQNRANLGFEAGVGFVMAMTGTVSSDEAAGSLLQAARNARAAEQMLSQLKSDSADRALSLLASKKEEYDKNKEEFARPIRSMGVSLFGLPAAAEVDRVSQIKVALEKGKDFRSLVAALDVRAQQDRGKLGRDYAFALVEKYWADSLVPAVDAAEQSDKTFALSKQCVAAAKLVPLASIFDTDRAAILWTAGRLAVYAAALEDKEHSWCNTFSPKAAYAVRVFDRATAYQIIDVQGDARELRAWALMLCGRRKDALQQALEVSELRRNSPTFHYHVAELYCALNDTRQASKEFEEAIHCGFLNFDDAKRNADLAPIRRKVNASTRLSAEGIVHVGPYNFRATGGMGGASLEVTNRSSFPLTHVKLTLQVSVGGNSIQKFSHEVDRIDPGSTYTWKNALATDVRRVRGNLVIQSDQGRLTVTPSVR
jgi:hypothetical protein